MRKAGILLPIFSLPGKYGIGTLSKEAYEFVDFLKKAGQSYWQILPLGPTGYGDSPYQSFSTFAGNPYFIDLDELVKDGLLKVSECKKYDSTGSNLSYVDYEKVYGTRFEILKLAFSRFDIKNKNFVSFVQKNAHWLEDYALYTAVKEAMGGKAWSEWDKDIKTRKPEAIEKYKKSCKETMDFYKFQQFYFSKQWLRLKKYANDNGIEIVGDIPIYVAFDSADAWANPELFDLNKENTPNAVAGCPPDPFAKLGQLWGNPLYKWDYHKKTGYEWWIKRIEHCFTLYDVVRIDHFRGFDEYYTIPYGRKDAVKGQWKPGPGIELFDTIKKKLGDKKIIAEDLGFLTDSVRTLVKTTGYPGMKICEFAFGGGSDSEYLAHNLYSNCIVYTGTHDNETARGWYKNADTHTKKYFRELTGAKGESDAADKMIRYALGTVADTAIIPMQDYLNLGNEARINTPSTLGNNWHWRMSEKMYTAKLASSIRKTCDLYYRVDKASK